MHVEDIENFLSKSRPDETEYIQIKFKRREAFYGLFLKEPDYSYLKAKNLWRIVPQSKLEAFKTSKDVNLAKIFNGEEFAKLTTYSESFE